MQGHGLKVSFLDRMSSLSKVSFQESAYVFGTCAGWIPLLLKKRKKRMLLEDDNIRPPVA